jgi:GT2 family glycosyltransferase
MSDSRVKIGIATNSIDLPFDLTDIDVIFSVPSGYASTRQWALTLREPEEGVIFLDDDNLISKNWLSGLIESIMKFPDFILKGKINYIDEDLLRVPNITDNLIVGQEIRYAGTANLYFPSFVVDSVEMYFNPQFDLGGEDTELTYRLHNSGHILKVADGFSVFEMVSSEKKTSNYLSHRFYASEKIFSAVVGMHGRPIDKLKRFLPTHLRKLPHNFLKKVRTRASNF